MDDADFTIISRNTLTPFRPRENLDGLVGLSGACGRAALVNPEVATAMRVRAHEALPNETGGLVLGRIYRDDLGPYTLILGFVEAPPEASSPGTIQMAPALVAKLEEAAAAMYPGYEVIGWWHSHHGPSPFSRTDLRTQKLWTNESHVGLLVFATGKPWAIAYQGPTASLLESTVTLPPSPSVAVATGNGYIMPNTKATPNNVYVGAPPPDLTQSGAGSTQKTVRLCLIAAATLVLGGTAVAVASNGGASGPNDTDINWTCRATPTTTVTCEADPVPGGDLEWFIGDTVIGTGAVVQIPDSVTGTISLRIRRTALTDLGSLNLASLAPAPTTTTAPTTTVPAAPTTTVGPKPTNTAPATSTTETEEKP